MEPGRHEKKSKCRLIATAGDAQWGRTISESAGHEGLPDAPPSQHIRCLRLIHQGTFRRKARRRFIGRPSNWLARSSGGPAITRRPAACVAPGLSGRDFNRSPWNPADTPTHAGRLRRPSSPANRAAAHTRRKSGHGNGAALTFTPTPPTRRGDPQWSRIRCRQRERKGFRQMRLKYRSREISFGSFEYKSFEKQDDEFWHDLW